ncbi:DMT family transporter [Massilia niastensis]|uniref:DMT family transporter n=1 Tax=Massilia niastensis TaxID=544911 RepID=UPI00037B2C30|nr:DMT family transporter [Massilia niastensis]
MTKGVLYALAAAALFGASTPFAKLLTGDAAPVALAGILYLGSGLGLAACLGWRRIARTQARHADAGLRRQDLPWLAGAVAAGGLCGPVLLMTGLAQLPASSASLLLNLEGVLTAALAWFVFKENCDRRVVLGMALIVAAGVLLSLEETGARGLAPGALAIAAACLCWAIDNNLTRKVAAADAVQIVAVKGLAAGTVNLLIAVATGAAMPGPGPALAAGVVGFCGYGLSLVMFVIALRHLGTARTGAYFSAAPFAGAAMSMLLLRETPGMAFWVAAALMAAGIWLHLTERHRHAHAHEALEHSHEHQHEQADEHHRHQHAFSWDPAKPHVHMHRHPPLRHTHEHYPDLHHRHRHDA